MEEVKHVPDLETTVGATAEQMAGSNNDGGHIGMSIIEMAMVNMAKDYYNNEGYFAVAKDLSANQVVLDQELLRWVNKLKKWGTTPKTTELLVKQGFMKANEFEGTRDEILAITLPTYEWLTESYNKFGGQVRKLKKDEQLPADLSRKFHIKCVTPEVLDKWGDIQDPGVYRLIMYEWVSEMLAGNDYQI